MYRVWLLVAGDRTMNYACAQQWCCSCQHSVKRRVARFPHNPHPNLYCNTFVFELNCFLIFLLLLLVFFLLWYFCNVFIVIMLLSLYLLFMINGKNTFLKNVIWQIFWNDYCWGLEKFIGHSDVSSSLKTPRRDPNTWSALGIVILMSGSWKFPLHLMSRQGERERRFYSFYCDRDFWAQLG